MQYNNKKRIKFLKNSLMISGLLLLIAMGVLIYLQEFGIVIFLSILLILALVLNRMLNLTYLRIQLENERVSIRYYSLFSVDQNYEAIEFPAASLQQVKVKKYLLGLKWDLHLAVRLKQGVARYPAVCLTAMAMTERKKLIEKLGELSRSR